MEPRKEAVERSDAGWVIDPGYTIAQFSVKNLLLLTVRGSFADVTGSITRDESDIRRSTVEARIKASSIDTGLGRRDRHLRSKDFLDIDQYPEIQFHSTIVERGTDRDTLRVTGVLTIKGKSKEVVLDVTEVEHSHSPRGEDVAYYTAQVKVRRFDFGVAYGRGLIGGTVSIRIHVQALKQER